MTPILFNVPGFERLKYFPENTHVLADITLEVPSFWQRNRQEKRNYGMAYLNRGCFGGPRYKKPWQSSPARGVAPPAVAVGAAQMAVSAAQLTRLPGGVR